MESVHLESARLCICGDDEDVYHKCCASTIKTQQAARRIKFTFQHSPSTVTVSADCSAAAAASPRAAVDTAALDPGMAVPDDQDTRPVAVGDDTSASGLQPG